MLETDGILGPATIAALQGFLGKLDLYHGDVDGVIDGLPGAQRPSATVRALQELLNGGLETVTITAVRLGA